MGQVVDCVQHLTEHLASGIEMAEISAGVAPAHGAITGWIYRPLIRRILRILSSARDACRLGRCRTATASLSCQLNPVRIVGLNCHPERRRPAPQPRDLGFHWLLAAGYWLLLPTAPHSCALRNSRATCAPS